MKFTNITLDDDVEAQKEEDETAEDIALVILSYDD